MKKYVGIGFTIIISFSGCGSIPKPDIVRDKSKIASLKILRNPKLNTINTVEVGENIYTSSYLFVDNTYQIKIDPDVYNNLEEGSFAYDLSHYVYNSIKKPTGYILRRFKEPYGNALCGIKMFPIVCLTDKGNTGGFNYLGNLDQGIFYSLDNTLKYNIVNTPAVPLQDSFKYQALYQGKIGNTIKISYREFVKDMIRPAFTQDVLYNLNPKGDTIIGFKGLRIDIIKATNFNITYKIIKGYNIEEEIQEIQK